MLMSLDEIRNVVLLFSNPSWRGGGTVSSTVIRNITALSSQMAYSAHFTGNTTVLSTRYAVAANGGLSGLLYVPDLPSGNPCVEETAPYVPITAVRQSDLPPTNYHLIAIAPWVSDRCASVYMASARTAPVRAFLFYMPGDDSISPPPAESPEWYIEDDADWTTQTNYPVFAVSSMVGEVMMQHLSLYSGNMTQVPFGQNITDRFLTDPEDYLRIWTELIVSKPPSAFGTWVYVLIIAGVLLIVICGTSLLMHLVQAQRRAALRSRVLAGQVNLEAMGIMRLTVPRDHIQKFPLFTYHYEPEFSSPPLSPQTAEIGQSRTRSRSLSQNQADTATASRVARTVAVSELGASGAFPASSTATDYQPNCEICLEAYENRVTIIRELPCGHIFHPDCIDEFLHEVSSLCPICKASMLPEGYCPKITNDIVRREYGIRRLRGRVDVLEADNEPSPEKSQGWLATAKRRLFTVNSRPVPSSPTELQEIQQRSQRRPSRGGQPRSQSTFQEGADSRRTRTALARERMRELAGFQPDYGDSRSTMWQRIRMRIFPGFH
ncbi:uncharacterized protein B0T15DRAFT_12338 [Chaetomium strumarium]|uniref:RING-type domain-containing protein n=1 Tax=Chaetomium strumarium TaxID=1170767 RepID=A0AAJ0H0R5_9PEZI|nr:hypothetical protein B0T15DRAFT_12338 [Chaetomium strumarium]